MSLHNIPAMEPFHTKLNLSDILTKALPASHLAELADVLIPRKSQIELLLRNADSALAG